MTEKLEKTKHRIIPDVRIGSGGLDMASLRTLAKNEPKEFMGKCNRLIDEGKLSLRNFNIRNAYLAFADVKVPAEMEILPGSGQTRAIMASAFPLLVGGLAVKGINDAYEAIPTIGEKLVTESESNKKIVQYAGISSLDTDVDEVRENEDFPEIGAGEEKFEIRTKRNGRRLSITKDTIEENDVPNIVERINSLAEIAKEIVEEQTLKRVTDHDGSAATPAEPYAFRPNGAGTQLYNATANNPGTRAPNGTRKTNNALADESDLENARVVLASMLNTRGKRIANPVSRMVLLVPDALAPTAQKTLNSVYTPGVENEKNVWGPEGSYRPQFVSSPKLDELSATAWYLGDFKRQFKRVWKIKFEYVTLGEDTESYLRRRIAFQARIAWSVEIGAVDYTYVLQNLAATTAPKDE